MHRTPAHLLTNPITQTHLLMKDPAQTSNHAPPMATRVGHTDAETPTRPRKLARPPNPPIATHLHMPWTGGSPETPCSSGRALHLIWVDDPAAAGRVDSRTRRGSRGHRQAGPLHRLGAPCLVMLDAKGSSRRQLSQIKCANHGEYCTADGSSKEDLVGYQGLGEPCPPHTRPSRVFLGLFGSYYLAGRLQWSMGRAICTVSAAIGPIWCEPGQDGCRDEGSRGPRGL